MIKAPDVTLLYVIVCFLIACAILKRSLFTPLGSILDAREQEERAAAKAQAESQAQLERAISHAEQELSRARQEALRERERLRAEGQAVLDRRLAETRTATHSSTKAAEEKIGEDAALSAAQLQERAPSLARLLAEKVLGRKLAA